MSGNGWEGFRVLNVMVERYQENLDDEFCFHAAQALREYADAVDKGGAGNRAVEEFRASNGCTVRTIHGMFNSARPGLWTRLRRRIGL